MKQLSLQLKKLLNEVRIEKHTIEYDSFDLHAFQDILFQNKKIAKVYQDGSKTYPQFAELHQDVYDALYKYVPQKVPDQSIDYNYLLNSQVMDAVIGSPKYKELRHLTKLDKVHATIGTEILGEQVKDLVKELQEKFEEAMKDAIEAAEQAQQAEQAQGNRDGEEGGQDGEGQEMSGSEQITVEEAQKRLEEAMSSLKDVVDKKAKRQVNKMMDMAVSETKETSDLISNWGLEQDPSFSKTGYQEKMKLLEELRGSQKLREIAKLAGRYKRLAINTMRTKIKKGVESLYDITQGNNIGRLIPSEAVKLKHPAMRTLFKKSYLEETLLQYEYAGTHKKSRGPIIACIDSSGSMSGAPEIWAKSVALGLLEVARAQKRPMYVIHFDAGFKDRLHTNSFPKGHQYNISEVLDLAQYFAGGGTLFEPPLELSRDKISNGSEYSKSDIIFITDGCSAVREAWLEDFMHWKKKQNVQIFSILMDVGYNTDAPLKLFSDSITRLKSLRNKDADAVAQMIFTQV
jgi:uncharacterized protein with von Willebrand factor type A (vWA) domain